jgi:hypothetical protein
MIHTENITFAKRYISCLIHGILPIIFFGIILSFSEHALAVEAGDSPVVTGSGAAAEPAKNIVAEPAPGKVSELEPEVESEPRPLQKTLSDAEKKPEPSVLEVIDNKRDFLAEKIVSYTKSIDQFFGDERYFQENNKSVIQLDLNETIGQGGDSTFRFEGKAKLDLPAAQKRFQFVIETNPEKKTAGDGKTDQPANLKEVATPEKYAASARMRAPSFNFRWTLFCEPGVVIQSRWGSGG